MGNQVASYKKAVTLALAGREPGYQLGSQYTGGPCDRRTGRENRGGFSGCEVVDVAAAAAVLSSRCLACLGDNRAQAFRIFPARRDRCGRVCCCGRSAAFAPEKELPLRRSSRSVQAAAGVAPGSHTQRGSTHLRGSAIAVRLRVPQVNATTAAAGAAGATATCPLRSEGIYVATAVASWRPLALESPVVRRVVDVHSRWTPAGSGHAARESASARLLFPDNTTTVRIRARTANTRPERGSDCSRQSDVGRNNNNGTRAC